MSRWASLSTRVGIGIMVLDHVYNGVWALVGAKSYYQALPGADPGQSSSLLNQVLIRDLGAARLTLALVLTMAAIWLDRRVLLAALGAATLSGAIRLASHAIARAPEGWNNWIGYSAAVLIPAALLWIALQARPDR